MVIALFRTGLLVGFVGCALVAAQAPGGPAAPDGTLSFEVASIRRSTVDRPQRSGIIPTPGRFATEHAAASALIGVGCRGLFDELQGVPEWARTERYSVTATFPDGATARDIPLMVRNLLRERFSFAFHTIEEGREVLALIRAEPDAPLTETTATVRILVVDRFERPSEN
ncbi:MAG: TIGR03435 family protein [Vicinamibacterales bacterium]